MKNPHKIQLYSSTFIGCIALVIWSFGATIITEIKHLPLFQFQSISFMFSFVITCIVVTYKKEWKRLKQPIFFWFISISVILLNQMGYVAGIKYSNPEQTELIYYLWPILIVLFTGFLPNEKFSLNHLIGAILGFAGIFVLVTGENDFFQINKEYGLGYSLAFLSGVSWAFYSLFSRTQKNAPVYLIGISSGVASGINFILHQTFETTVPITFHDLFFLMLFGGGVIGGAISFWDYGVKNGNFKFLSVLSFLSPVFSVLILVLFGKTEPTISLAIASMLVVLGCLYSGYIEQMNMKNHVDISLN